MNFWNHNYHNDNNNRSLNDLIASEKFFKVSRKTFQSKKIRTEELTCLKRRLKKDYYFLDTLVLGHIFSKREKNILALKGNI